MSNKDKPPPALAITPMPDSAPIAAPLHGIWLRLAQSLWLALALLIVGLCGWAVSIWIWEGNYWDAAWLDIPYGILMPLGYFGIAIFIFLRKPNDKMALLTSLMLVFLGPYLLTGINVTIGEQPGWEGVNRFLLGIGGGSFLLFFLTFPDGRFVPAWIRWLFVFITLLYILSVYFSPEIYGGLSAAVILLTVVSAIGVQAYRYLRVSSAAQRQQTKWIVLGGLGPALLMVYWILVVVPGIVKPSTNPFIFYTQQSIQTVLAWLFPVSLVFSIFRYRLWDIDILINRTLVYGVLTLSTMGLYVLVVGGAGNLLRLGNNTFIAFLTTGLVALLFQPLRIRLQSAVNRWMYGERDDPVAVLSKLGAELEHSGSPEDTLARIAESVARALKLPYAAIYLGEAATPIAAYGFPRSEDGQRFPLVYQNKASGYLWVARRSPGEPFTPSDVRLLENLAHQAGAAAHAAKLTTDLRLSRQKLITAREEERRRIRRDLHDGLGPTLASLALRLDAARNLLESDPETTAHMLADLKRQAQIIIQDVRALVYELRPPALDELGLAGALQNFIEGQALQHPQINLEMPKSLPPLPAAIEVAAYRIALEGLNNALRHAGAAHITVGLRIEKDHLCVEVRDDGRGISPQAVAGMGLNSMRERAEELGGSFEILPDQGGVCLRARLPLLEMS